jgi:DNA mismatch repair protein MutS
MHILFKHILYIYIRMNYEKEILVKDYFDIHNFYKKIYGEKTYIMMQVGSFHEAYATDEDGLDLVKIAQELDVVCTKKNGKEVLSRSNPRMIGFPIGVKDVFIEKLCGMNYTVILIDQTTDPPKPKREITGIYSPTTFIDSKNLMISKSNFLVSIVIDKKNSKSNQLCIGIASYDLSTGYGTFYETYSNENDLMLALDDTIRYLETCPPREIILYTTLEQNETICNMNLNNILGYIDLDNTMTLNLKINNLNKKISYQEEIFNKIFTDINIFEKTNLSKYNWARLALINLYDYTKNHQDYLLTNLRVPKEFDNNNFLYLGNHALEQLDVFNINIGEKGLFDIINNTKTLVGKRYLKLSLSQPLIDVKEINKRIDLIEKLIINKKYIKISNFLEDICDLERLIRRMEIGKLHPFELNSLYISCYQINKIIEYSKQEELFDINLNYINHMEIINYIESTFEISNICNLNFSNFTQYNNTIFKLNKYNQIDELYNKIQSSENFMENLVTLLSEYIDDKKTKSTEMLTLKYNDRDGHYLLITSRRCEILKTKLESLKEITVGTIKVLINEFEFTQMPKSNYIKLTCNKMKSLSNELVIYKMEMAKLTQKYFIKECEIIINLFGKTLIYWSQQIGFIDFINSGAISAIENHYSKPIVIDKPNSYFVSENMRHPIVEKISTQYEYKPHSISLGNDICGILLFGINSSGKSTLMKSIGLNVILAQIGYYTSSTYFEISPYKSLFTRISGNDNIHRGLSSFMVEMMELTSILKRNNANSLVIGDEISKGTENTSGAVIVSYMLKTLSESGTSFITATHLHELVNLPTVKNLSNIKFKHIKITYDDNKDKLIYDRELSDGSGPSFYGLTVAKYFMKDNKFNEITNDILKEVQDINEIKHSYYNKDNYLIECIICKSNINLETHHIQFQKDFTDNININKLHYYKNANYNLVTLCRKCHDDVDRNKIIINGWSDTSNGRELNYYITNEIIKSNKYNDDLVDYIKNLKKEINDPKMARIKIKEKYNKKVSTDTIKKFWLNI